MLFVFSCLSVQPIVFSAPTSGPSDSIALRILIDAIPPAQIKDLTVKTGDIEGSLFLSWTEPGNDGMIGQASIYHLRYSSISNIDSAVSFATATEFFHAWVPGVSGTRKTVRVENLVPGLTYYWALVAEDLYKQVGDWDVSSALTNYAPAKDDFPVAVQGVLAEGILDEVTLKWDALADADQTIDFDFYRIYRSTSATFVPEIVVTTLTKTATSDTDFKAPGRYYYRIVGVDKGTSSDPPYFGDALESQTWLPVDAVPFLPRFQLALPQPPGKLMGIRSADGATFTLTWEPPTARTDRTALPAEQLGSFEVLKMQALTGPDQTYHVCGSAIRKFEDANLSESPLFYKVRAVDSYGLHSPDSYIVVTPEDPPNGQPMLGDIYALLEDRVSYLKVPGQEMLGLYDKNLDLAGTRRAFEEREGILKSMDVTVANSLTRNTQNRYVFDRPVELSLTVPDPIRRVSSAFTQMNNPTRSRPLSIYWYNGERWIKMGTKVHSDETCARILTKMTGAYQLRSPGSSDERYVFYPKTITPNSDGINDVAFFFCDSPADAPIKGAIFDVTMAKIADLQTTPAFLRQNNILTWDGKDNSGEVVPGGIYYYKLEIEGETFTGGVAVAR